MKYTNILEEEIKNSVTQDFFQKFDCTRILGKIDFAVKAPLNPPEGGKNSPPSEGLGEAYLLWAEAKQKPTNVFEMLTQLVLTIGKARTFNEILPPPFLGCFDNEKIAFIPYSDIQDIFYQNDFNWNVAPSNHETREFKQVYEQIKNITSPNPSKGGETPSPLGRVGERYIFDFEKDENELREFIKINFIVGKTETSKIRIDKNNFITIYNKWFDAVKPTIAVDWEAAKKRNIIDGDFYLADLLSIDNQSIKEKLSVFLVGNYYKYIIGKDDLGELFRQTDFSDNQKAHHLFWAKYERPPIEQYWDYIIARRDLIVPQDIRERKGSFYTPRIWVELSQKYLADVFGNDWQDEYYIWDCAAGTGNLLAGLTNKYNLWASTLDKQDVDVMYDRIKNGANLLESHVFQFDFLNDDFSKLPQGLQDIINDPKRRKKLIIYINPPYAEASSYGKGSIPQVANMTKIFTNYKHLVGAEALSELFAQFFIRVYQEIPDANLTSFSTPKYITSEKFAKFRSAFKAEYKKGFICRSDTFDNVTGKFPIGFFIWNLSKKADIKKIKADIFFNDKDVKRNWQKGVKYFHALKHKSIADWRTTFYSFNKSPIGYMIIVGPSMQSNNNTFITNYPAESYKKKKMVASITIDNLIEMSIYLSVRQCINNTWLNNRDLFLYPNNKWKKDFEFQNNCLAYALFNNNISSKYGVNHWIPFMEQEVDAQDKFESHFMISFISGKLIQNGYSDLFEQQEEKTCIKRIFSPEATAVLNAGKALWIYYHTQPNININASLYDIKEYFQGRNENGKMNNKSEDEKYNELIKNLRETLNVLAEKIEPKVYEYGFLMR